MRVGARALEGQLGGLDEFYLIVYLGCIVPKACQDKRPINKALYRALGINPKGHKERPGLWLADTEGVTLGLSMLTALQSRPGAAWRCYTCPVTLEFWRCCDIEVIHHF